MPRFQRCQSRMIGSLVDGRESDLEYTPLCGLETASYHIMIMYCLKVVQYPVMSSSRCSRSVIVFAVARQMTMRSRIVEDHDHQERDAGTGGLRTGSQAVVAK